MAAVPQCPGPGHDIVNCNKTQNNFCSGAAFAYIFISKKDSVLRFKILNRLSENIQIQIFRIDLNI